MWYYYHNIMALEFPALYMGIIIYFVTTLILLGWLYHTKRKGYGGFSKDWYEPLGVLIVINLITLGIIIISYVKFT